MRITCMFCVLAMVATALAGEPASELKFIGPLDGAKPQLLTHVAFSPDGKLLAVTNDKGIELWDMAKRKMVLAIPVFGPNDRTHPTCVAYMPRSQVKPTSRGFRCQPACLKSGHPEPRRDYRKFFDANGLSLIENEEWKATPLHAEVEPTCAA